MATCAGAIAALYDCSAVLFFEFGYEPNGYGTVLAEVTLY